MFNNFLFLNRNFYEIMWKNILDPGTPQMKIWRMRLRIVCQITKATNMQSEYVILDDFPLQQWLHERASVLRSAHTDCLAIKNKCTSGS